MSKIKQSALMLGSIFILSTSCFNVNGSSSMSGQQDPKSDRLCEAFLIGFEKVKLYDKVNGVKIGEIKNSFEEELYFSIKILEQEDNWFNIRAQSIGDTVSGWMLNKSYLGTYSRNYSDTLFVYLEDNKKRITCSIPVYFTSPMEIIECKKDWVKVKLNDSGLSCDGGWILQSMTCSSPYTTCP